MPPLPRPFPYQNAILQLGLEFLLDGFVCFFFPFHCGLSCSVHFVLAVEYEVNEEKKEQHKKQEKIPQK